MNSLPMPYVSVIYLTKNGGSLFKKSLLAVFSQKTNFPVEVVVVDSGSNDGTLEFIKEQPVKLQSITPGSFNFGLTRDYGFSLSQGEILVTLSQDAIPAGTDWLQRICQPFTDPSVVVVQGEEEPPAKRGLFFWDKIRLFYFTRESKRWIKLHNGLGISFVNCAIRRSVWQANPLGRIDMSEDKVFQKRLAQLGKRIIFVPEAKVYHSHQYDRQSLEKRCKNEGLGWKLAGINYSRRDMLLDMFHPLIWLVLVYGIVTLQIRTSAEFLFPWIRPIYLYEGNHFINGYIR